MAVKSRKEITPGQILHIPKELYEQLTPFYGEDLSETLNRRFFKQTDSCTDCEGQNQVISRYGIFRFQRVASSTGQVLYKIRCVVCENIVRVQERKRIEDEKKRQRKAVLEELLPVLQPLLASKSFQDNQVLFQWPAVLTNPQKYAAIDFLRDNNLKCGNCGELDARLTSAAVEISDLPDTLTIECLNCAWLRHSAKQTEEFHDTRVRWRQEEQERRRTMRRVSRQLRKHLDTVELR